MLFGSAVAHQVSSMVARADDALEPLLDWRPGREKAKAPTIGKTAEVHTIPTAAANGRHPLSARQYLYQLNLETRALTKAETLDVVVGVTSKEVLRVARLVARLRGRYLAQLLELGAADRTALTDAEIAELRRARERFDEMDRGFADLKAAIESGEIELDGLRAD
jgi:hypothetical protein